MSTHGADPQLPVARVDTVVSIGEVETLKRIFPRLPAASSALLGPGDDAAVVAAPDGRFVVTTDMMIHGPDFRLAWSTAHDLGWKAAVSNLADVAAMGATPSALVVAIAAPLDTPVALLEGISDGLRDACAALSPGTGVVGGDLSVSNTLTLAVTAFGDLDGRPPVTRAGARPGDVVAVAGDLGRAGAGIWLLFDQGVHTEREPDTILGQALRVAHPVLVEAQLAPTSPLQAGRSAAQAGATAMLDVSDGLVLDAGRIATASGCSLELFHEAIEAEADALREVDAVVGAQARDFVLCGGEDHALLATFPAGQEVPPEFRVIGEVRGRAAGHPLVTIGGEAYVRPGGWDPFADWNGGVG
ncbi:thiamine-phosphate kinase [Subtercola frigoramans]|uniref:Thiamine-monophosphate kinase n=1 Tax=Subtercola frigoramans TaxID=120298 RepID=A0ABS2L7L0_9MICO|nr:thiamine-phosphate kinase [Subtercola frigoramans]MBM7472969.1 thiamine-monophosphate kinase [Subtercola frigoramans]